MLIRVSIVEDDAPARHILAGWLGCAAPLELASQHADGPGALAGLPEAKPDVVLMDINLPGLNGIECVRQLKGQMPGTQFLMLTVYEDADRIFHALAAGATGYLLKETLREDLLAAIDEVHRGGSPMTSSIARKVVQAFQAAPPAAPETEPLSAREQEVLALLARGFLYKEIAATLAISPSSVNTYIRRIYEKLHVHSRSQAVLRCPQGPAPLPRSMAPRPLLAALLGLLLFPAPASLQGAQPAVPEPAPVLNRPALLDARGRGDTQWFLDNIPFFECPDKDLTDIYYYRWWNYRKNLRWNAKSDGWTVHEGGGYGITPCPLGHHIYEGRWLKNRAYLQDYLRFWFTGQDNPRRYSTWLADGSYARFLADNDAPAAVAMLPRLRANYEAWEKERFDPAKGLFKWIPDRDGMEASLAGFEQGETNRFEWNTVIFGGEGYRPSLNSYMCADARAIARLAEMAGDTATARLYQGKSDALKARLLAALWSPEKEFFLQRHSRNDQFVTGREQIGFFPWAFHVPDDTAQFAQAWKQLRDPAGFEAKYGPTTLERRSPYYLRPFKHGCLWNGPSWPYSTSLTLAALANLLNDYHQEILTAADYIALLRQYAATQHDPDGKPMVREDHHPDENRWLASGADYNHSRYCDLIITGLAGLRPRAGDLLEINPLVPASWDFFCLEGVPYHGRLVTILFDRTGARYGKGAGLRVLLDGTEAAQAPAVRKLTIPFASRVPPPPPATRPVEPPGIPPGNLALNPSAKGFPQPSASFTCPRDDVWAAVDGRLSFEDQPRNRWTSYGSGQSSDWLAIDLGKEYAIAQAIVWFYDDQTGVRAPASFTIQYWKDSGWVDCPNPKQTPAVSEGGTARGVAFSEVLARKFRVVFTHQKGFASGVTELGFYPPRAPKPPAKS